MPDTKGDCYNGKDQQCRDCINYYTNHTQLSCDLPEIFASFDSILEKEKLNKFIMNPTIDKKSKIMVAQRLNALEKLEEFPEIKDYLINRLHIPQNQLTQFDPKNSTRDEIINKLKELNITILQ